MIFVRQTVLFFLLVILLLAGPVVAPAIANDVAVVDVRLGSKTDGSLRFVLQTDQKISYNLFFLKQPNRAVLDVPALHWPRTLTPSGKGIVKGWRRGQFGQGTRVVLDLAGPVTVVAIQALPVDGGRTGQRLVIDLKPVDDAAFASLLGRAWGDAQGHSLPSLEQRKQEAQGNSLSAPALVEQSSQDSYRAEQDELEHVLRLPEVHEEDIVQNSARGTTAEAGEVPSTTHRYPLAAYTLPFPPPPDLPSFRQTAPYHPVIVIDAGHGGVDPGALALNGQFEKDLTLQIAKRLAGVLIATGRYDVKLTRSTDIFIPLRERVAIARAYKGDLFISLHADSHAKSTMHGATVYTLSDQASDKEAAMLAESENRADILAGLDAAGKDDSIASILSTMSYRATLNHGKDFSRLVVQNLGQMITMNTPAERSAGFAVLKSPDIPSVLIEMGYLSNAKESKSLYTASYQARLATHIASAVEKFFNHR